MKTLSEIQPLLDQHIQVRPNSCAASGYEMVLKVLGYLPVHDYRYQARPENEGIGFDTIQRFEETGTIVDFSHKCKPPNEAFAEIRSELKMGRPSLISVHNHIVYDVWKNDFQLGSAHIWICVGELNGAICALTKSNGVDTSSPTDVENLLISAHKTFSFYTVDYVTCAIK